MIAQRQSAVVRVAEAPHLCRLQAATREICRAGGQGEAAVFEAVIAVTELAHRLFIEASRAGDVSLEVLRFKHGSALEIRAEDEGAAASRRPPVSVCLNFSPARPEAS